MRRSSGFLIRRNSSTGTCLGRLPAGRRSRQGATVLYLHYLLNLEFHDAGLAHLVEQRYRKPQVVGSSPTASSMSF
jgi:hypothetical protein